MPIANGKTLMLFVVVEHVIALQENAPGPSEVLFDTEVVAAHKEPLGPAHRVHDLVGNPPLACVDIL